MLKKIFRLSSPIYWKNKLDLFFYDYKSSKEIIDLNQSQWWSYGKLVDFQNKRLRQIIYYAYNNIPCYRKKFDKAGIKPKDIKSQKDLGKLPITTREELQDNKDFVNKKLISSTLYTGGSTGTSLKYYESSDSGKIRWNCHLRGWLWSGYIPGKKMAIISSTQGVISGKLVLNLAGELTSKKLKLNIKYLAKFKPRYLRGYVASIYILAKYCVDNNINLSGIESITVISENFYDFQKQIIKKAFKCHVFEEYVCNDGGACAWECQTHEGLHYFMERSIIEEIDGEMIVTDLWNKAMPFIRYKNGDTVKFLNKKCSCGRKLPLLSVRGRTNDIIITKKGFVSPAFLLHHGIGIGTIDKPNVHFRSGIRAVQYVQKPGYLLQVNIVKNSWCGDNEIKDLKKTLNKILHGMQIKINFVDNILSTKRGKRSFIINEDNGLLKKWGFS